MKILKDYTKFIINEEVGNVIDLDAIAKEIWDLLETKYGLSESSRNIIVEKLVQYYNGFDDDDDDEFA